MTTILMLMECSIQEKDKLGLDNNCLPLNFYNNNTHGKLKKVLRHKSIQRPLPLVARLPIEMKSRMDNIYPTALFTEGFPQRVAIVIFLLYLLCAVFV